MRNATRKGGFLSQLHILGTRTQGFQHVCDQSSTASGSLVGENQTRQCLKHSEQVGLKLVYICKYLINFLWRISRFSSLFCSSYWLELDVVRQGLPKYSPWATSNSRGSPERDITRDISFQALSHMETEQEILGS